MDASATASRRSRATWMSTVRSIASVSMQAQNAAFARKEDPGPPCRRLEQGESCGLMGTADDFDSIRPVSLCPTPKPVPKS
jgi:hypothetical protein